MVQAGRRRLRLVLLAAFLTPPAFLPPAFPPAFHPAARCMGEPAARSTMPSDFLRHAHVGVAVLCFVSAAAVLVMQVSVWALINSSCFFGMGIDNLVQ
ncbi:unnamed protein product, partial [Effrenium voratum]